MSAAGLLRPAFFLWRFAREWTPALAIRNVRLGRQEKAFGYPLPPAALMYSVAGSRDAGWFLESGQQSATSLREALARAGRPLETLNDVLDMGCGCGRVLRQWRSVTGPRFYGTDYNPAGVQWVREHMPFVDAKVNRLAPPLEYPGETFDAIYAISVLTHLPEELQRPWMAEFRRVLRPGGLLLITLSGRGFLSRLTPAEDARFSAGELVIVDARYAGTNMCSAYHPDEYVRGPWSEGFSILERVPHTPTTPYQDLWVLRRD